MQDRTDRGENKKEHSDPGSDEDLIWMCESGTLRGLSGVYGSGTACTGDDRGNNLVDKSAKIS